MGNNFIRVKNTKIADRPLVENNVRANSKKGADGTKNACVRTTGGIIGAETDNKLIIDIIHFNDVYNLKPQYKEDPVGGASRFITVVKDIIGKLAVIGRKPLILFSGDFVGPSLMSTISHGAHIIDALNLIGVNYATFGNHEFDYGYTSLINRLAGIDDDVTEEVSLYNDYPQTTSKWLMTNMTEGATGLPVGGKWAEKTAIFDWGQQGNQIKVGILAVSENWLAACSQLKPNEIVYEDYIECARRTAIELRAKGADLILALTHSRLEGDFKLTTAVPEIDLLLGGHDHFYKRVRDSRIVKGGEEWRWLNYVNIEIVVDAFKVNSSMVVHTERYDIDEDIPEDPGMSALIAKYERLTEIKYSKVLATTSVALDPTEESVRYRESVLANWICDLCSYDYSESQGLQESDIVMIMGFSFAGKKVFQPGNFTLGDLMSVFPLPTQLVVIKLKGSDIVKSLTLGVSTLPRECGSIHHVSRRLKYTVVIPKARDRKPSVTNVLFDDQPIDLSREYIVGITNSMAKGKFGYTWFAQAERIFDEESAAQIQDIVKSCCERLKLHLGITPPALGRIIIQQEK